MSTSETIGNNSRFEEEASEWVSLKGLKKVLEGLPTPLQTKIMNGVGGSIITDIEKPQTADLFLLEVTKRVFGFSLNDLSSHETREIERIRKELGLPGEFNPYKKAP